MQASVCPENFSIHEIEPFEFASLCNEVHVAMRDKLAGYLQEVVENSQGALFATFDSNGECDGHIYVEINPKYVTHGKPCSTFGWLDATNVGSVQLLLGQACDWASKREILINGNARRNAILRGPISFPKNLGGIGCQVEGFQMPRMYGVPANRPELGLWIEASGFKQDAPYACVNVFNTPSWESAPDKLNGFSLVTLTGEQWRQREAEIVDLAKMAFGDFLPDTILGRFEEAWGATASMSNTFYAWPAVLDREDHLAGLVVCLPNLWQTWDGHPVTDVNVDTVVIAPQYRGKGLFSALHDYGYRNLRGHCGINYFEGTAIWCANENAVKSIFPHGTLVRKHVVFQKRLKKT